MSVTSVRVDTSNSDKKPYFLPVHDISITSYTLLSRGTLFCCNIIPGPPCKQLYGDSSVTLFSM